MLINNRVYIKNTFPKLYNRLNELNEVYQIVPAKNGEDTLVLTIDEKEISYHSRYNPMQEAQRYVDSLGDLSEFDHIIQIGVGLGCHISLMLKVSSNIKITVYEPNLQVLKAFLNSFDLTKGNAKQINLIFSDFSDLENRKVFFDGISEKTRICIFPSALNFNEKEIFNFSNEIKNTLEQRKQSLLVDVSFQSRWIKNSILNLPKILDTPNLFLHTDAFENLKNKPVVLVAAGPSLNLELNNLKMIKEDGSAYIFAVGSAVNSLLSANIMPDALFSYDPTEKNAQVVEKIKELNSPIPLIFGSSIGYEVLNNYPGKMVHFFTNQDSISHNLISLEKNYTILDAPSIAVVTLNILMQLNASEIILVGQNLGLVGNKHYAEGISYINPIKEKDVRNNYIEIEDVDGNIMLTTDGFLAMKQGFEQIILHTNSSSKVINTTVNGANIKGTEFISLSEVMDRYLSEHNIVGSAIFSGNNNYVKQEILSKYKQLENSFDQMFKAYKNAVDAYSQVLNDYERNIYNKVELHLNQFDKFFREIETTDFFTMVVGPVTRVQYKELVNRSAEVKFTKNPKKKMEFFIEIFSKYMRAIYATIIDFQPVFGELKQSNLFKEGKKS